MNKIAKKLLLTISTVMLFVVLSCFGASAFVTSTECGENVMVTYNSGTKTLTFSGTGDMWDFYNSPFITANGFDIEKIVFEKGVTNVGENAFGGCENLKSVKLSNTITSIGKNAFSDCYNLKSISIPKSVREIGSRAFCMCSGLEKLTLANGVKTIGEYAFLWCTELKNITIPASVTSIDRGAFLHASNIKVDSKNLTFSSDSYGVLYDKNKSVLIQYPAGNTRTFYEVPKGVKELGYQSLSGADIQEIIIPSSVTYIDEHAFYLDSTRVNVYYMGSKKNWDNITIQNEGNEVLWYEGSAIHYCSVKTTKKATPTANGAKSIICSDCNYTKKQTIAKASKISLSATTGVYNGKVKTPSVTVKDSNGKALKKGTDYTVKYESGRKLPGKYAVTVTFKGNYSGTKTLYFTITPNKTSKVTATQTTSAITLKWAKAAGAKGYKVYRKVDGKWKAIADTSKLTYTIKKLKTATNYSFAVRPYAVDGKDTILAASFTQLNTATKCATPTLKVTSGKKGVASLAWTNVAGESGYEVYGSSKKDSGYKKLATTKTNANKATKSKLTSKKTYYFKVRAYKTVGGAKVYSAFSAVKSVKVK